MVNPVFFCFDGTPNTLCVPFLKHTHKVQKVLQKTTVQDDVVMDTEDEESTVRLSVALKSNNSTTSL